MSGPVQEDKYLLQTNGNTFILLDFTPFLFSPNLPFLVGRAGLGPSPGWGPVQVGAHIGPYGTSWIGLGRLRKVSVRLLD